MGNGDWDSETIGELEAELETARDDIADLQQELSAEQDRVLELRNTIRKVVETIKAELKTHEAETVESLSELEAVL